MLLDTQQERDLQKRFDRLRAELAVPACSGDCKSCGRMCRRAAAALMQTQNEEFCRQHPEQCLP